MIILFGFRTLQKILGFTCVYACPRCNNAKEWQIIRARQWFTLFFIPIIPFSTKYYQKCPVCGLATGMTKQQSEQYILDWQVAQSEHAQQNTPENRQFNNNQGVD